MHLTDYKVTFRQTSELSSDDVSNIFRIKDQHWKYGIKSQENWFNNNIDSKDIHLLIYRGNELLAYSNLVNIKVTIDGCSLNAFGLGNVCVSIEHSKCGLGSILVSFANLFLKSRESLGLLLCKNSLISFYEFNKWRVLECKELIVSGSLSDSVLMCFNKETGIAGFPNTIMINRCF